VPLEALREIDEDAMRRPKKGCEGLRRKILDGAKQPVNGTDPEVRPANAMGVKHGDITVCATTAP
jgi:hypothetical protein